MAYNHNVNHILKYEPRRILFSQLEGVAKSGLFFPAKHCLDLKLGIEMGKINEETVLILFEKDPGIMEYIKAFCKKHGLKNSYFFNMKFEDMLNRIRRKNVITDIKGNDAFQRLKKEDDEPHSFSPMSCLFHLLPLIPSVSCEYAGEEGFEIAFFDFCGEMTQKLEDVLKCFYNCEFLHEAIMGFTFSLKKRNNKYLDNSWNNIIKFRTNPIVLSSSRKCSSPIEFTECERTNQISFKTVQSVFNSVICSRNYICDYFKVYKEEKSPIPMVFFMTNQKRAYKELAA